MFLPYNLNQSPQKSEDVPSPSLAQRSDTDSCLLQLHFPSPTCVENPDDNFVPSLMETFRKDNLLPLRTAIDQPGNEDKNLHARPAVVSSSNLSFLYTKSIL